MSLESTEKMVKELRSRGHNVTFIPNPSDEQLERINKLIARTKKSREDAIERYKNKGE
jgi:hypothetical protein